MNHCVVCVDVCEVQARGGAREDTVAAEQAVRVGVHVAKASGGGNRGFRIENLFV